MDAFQDNKRSLRAAIISALELADAQGDHLVAAFLSQALDAADRIPPTKLDDGRS